MVLASADAGLDHGGGDAVAAAAPVLAGRLALVPGNAASGNWTGPVRRSGRGRSLHLPARDRAFDRTGLGHGGRYRAWPRFRRVSIAVVTCLLATMLVSAWCQTGFWRDSETLWKHTLACTSRNAVAHNDLGIVLAAAGRLDEAMSNYRKAIEVREDYAEAHRNLGAA